jgi:hypothetical protein
VRQFKKIRKNLPFPEKSRERTNDRRRIKEAGVTELSPRSFSPLLNVNLWNKAQQDKKKKNVRFVNNRERYFPSYRINLMSPEDVYQVLLHPVTFTSSFFTRARKREIRNQAEEAIRLSLIALRECCARKVWSSSTLVVHESRSHCGTTTHTYRPIQGII